MKYLILVALFVYTVNCKNAKENIQPTNNSTSTINEVDVWLTKSDQTVILQKQNTTIGFTSATNIYPTIEIDDAQHFQTIDGFGYTLTGGSAQVINQLSTAKKQELLQDLFGNNSNSISINYLRISIGASDLNTAPFTYNDMPNGQTDINLTNFSLANDTINLIPILKEIININPNIKIMAAPWSPPIWMKDNNSFIGGSLQAQYYAVYAQYFVKYIQKMKQLGITIDAITPQNEPLHPGNNPSLLMLANEQANFIKNNLGPAFQNANITTKIVIYDHNCDRIDYPTNILNDAQANAFIDGSAYHLYAGDINAMSTVHNAFPNKNIYFTEQYTSSTGDFGGDLEWHIKNVIIGSMRNWSRNALEWNLASDASYGPHTVGGCSTCKGAITVVGNSSYRKNVSYYIIAHASKFIPAGSVRIASNIVGNLQNVAFKLPSGKIVMILENDGNNTTLFNVKYAGKWFTTSITAGSVATYLW